MKKLIIAAAALIALTTSAKADVPEIMRGHWCAASGINTSIGEGYFNKVDGEEWKKCQEGDGYLTLSRTGYVAHETTCRFLSVRDTGRKSAPWTKPYPKEMVPIVRVAARCTQEDSRYKVSFEFTYLKGGGLQIEVKK
jgi:phage-related protein